MEIPVKVLCVFAHPDDEVLFGFPVLQEKSLDRHLIILTSGHERHGDKPIKALKEICSNEGINFYEVAGLSNQFYRLPYRYDDFVLSNAAKMVNDIVDKAIAEIRPDFIMTHNPMGEYGHGDHKLCFELIATNPNVKNLIITDTALKDIHISYDKVPKVYQQNYYRKENYYMTSQIDMDFFNRCLEVYKKHGVWTGRQDTPYITKANLYHLLKD